MSGGCARSSPRVSPASRLRCRSGSPSAPLAACGGGRWRGAGRIARPPPDHGVDDQPAGEVPVADEALVRPGGLHQPEDRHPLARQPVVEARGGRCSGDRPRAASAERTSTLTPPRPSGSGSPTSVTSAWRRCPAERRGRPRCADRGRRRGGRGRRTAARARSVRDGDRGGPARRPPPPARSPAPPAGRCPSTAPRAARNTPTPSDSPAVAHVGPPTGPGFARAPGPPAVTPSPGRAAARAWPRRYPARRGGRRRWRTARSAHGGRRSPAAVAGPTPRSASSSVTEARLMSTGAPAVQTRPPRRVPPASPRRPAEGPRRGGGPPPAGRRPG